MERKREKKTKHKETNDGNKGKDRGGKTRRTTETHRCVHILLNNLFTFE